MPPPGRGTRMHAETEIAEKRLFPRITARCPVLYRVEGVARRQVAISTDFSATGVKMVCKQALVLQAAIEVEFKPGSNKSVPAMVAHGHVLRCEAMANGEFLVACRFTRVQAVKRA